MREHRIPSASATPRVNLSKLSRPGRKESLYDTGLLVAGAAGALGYSLGTTAQHPPQPCSQHSTPARGHRGRGRRAVEELDGHGYRSKQRAAERASAFRPPSCRAKDTGVRRVSSDGATHKHNKGTENTHTIAVPPVILLRECLAGGSRSAASFCSTSVRAWGGACATGARRGSRMR